MKSLLALVASVWFAFNAVTFGDGGGDQGVMAVGAAARILFVGLAVISLALVDWERIGEFFDPEER